MRGDGPQRHTCTTTLRQVNKIPVIRSWPQSERYVVTGSVGYSGHDGMERGNLVDRILMRFPVALEQKCNVLHYFAIATGKRMAWDIGEALSALVGVSSLCRHKPH
jgi:hypothetical protein